MKTPFDRRRTAFTLPAVALGLLCGALFAHGGHAANAAAMTPTGRSVVTIHGYSFDPGVMKVAAGATVTWINRDEDVHTIRTQDGPQAFQSRALDSGGRFSFTFRRAGTYRYICSVHPYMRGVIVVQ